MKTSDIPDEVIVEAIRRTRGRNGVPEWATTWDLLEALPEYPPKLVLSKCRSLIKRKVIDGCSCSLTEPYCRGDFEVR